MSDFKPAPADDYDGLLLQFNALLRLYNSTRGQCSLMEKTISELKRKIADGSLAAVESERAANAELTAEVEQLRAIVESVPEGCTPADARMLREANHALADENALLSKCLKRVVNLYMIDDYYHAEQRETMIKDHIEKMMRWVKAEANQIEAGQ